jgi:hypothetical protein
MVTLLRGAIVAAFALAPLSSYALCGCECVDGAPRTVCTKVGEAAADPALCGLDPPLCAPVGTPAPKARFDPPPGARDCRAAAIADAAAENRAEAQAEIVKVCEPLQRPDAP